MKTNMTSPMVFVVSMLVATAAALCESSRSAPWVVPENVFGQLKLVPTVTLPRFAEEKGWEGPSEAFGEFLIVVTCTEGWQTGPEKFHFVTPAVGLEGRRGRTIESSTRVAPMFRKKSSQNDLMISFEPPPEFVRLNTEYHAATVSSPQAETEWKVLVRFLDRQDRERGTPKHP